MSLRGSGSQIAGITVSKTPERRFPFHRTGGTPPPEYSDGFWDNIPSVIFLPKYSISGENYFQRRRKLLNSILKTAAGLGLNRTEDRIEDYGQHFYIVTKMEKGRDETWT